MARAIGTIMIIVGAVLLCVGLAGVARGADPATIDVVGSISGDTVAAVEEGLDKAGGDPVVVKIDSTGGGVVAGLRVIEVLRQYPGPVTCEVGGVAFSMAAIILESPGCKVRVVRPWSAIMFHGVSASGGGAVQQLAETMKSVAALDRSLAIIVSRRVGWTPDEYLRATEHELWMTGADAVAAKFADKEQP